MTMKQSPEQKVARLEAALFTAADGIAAWNAISPLTKLANQGSREAKNALAAYVTTGTIPHMRQQACAGRKRWA